MVEYVIFHSIKMDNYDDSDLERWDTQPRPTYFTYLYATPIMTLIPNQNCIHTLGELGGPITCILESIIGRRQNISEGEGEAAYDQITSAVESGHTPVPSLCDSPVASQKAMFQ